jgi:hypothetical protein
MCDENNLKSYMHGKCRREEMQAKHKSRCVNWRKSWHLEGKENVGETTY